MRTLDFTPSDSSFPIKLPSLHSCGTFESLPEQLLFRTRRNPSMLKNLLEFYQNTWFICSPPAHRLISHG
jgi:hypothetical protein